jgi:MFS transporter, FSR family, fosmidomycin resistance protein
MGSVEEAAEKVNGSPFPARMNGAGTVHKPEAQARGPNKPARPCDFPHRHGFNVTTPTTTIPQDSDIRSAERWLVFITSIGHAVCHMGELLFPGVALAVMAEFRLAPHEVYALGLLGYVLLGLGALPMGAWADAWGPARVLQIYFVLMAAASVGVALSAEPWQLFITLTLLGVAASIYHPAGLTLLSQGTRRRGRAMGINGVVGSVGQALGPLLGLCAAGMGMWRLAFVVLAGLSLLAGGLMLLAQRRLARSGGLALLNNGHATTASPAAGDPVSPVPSLWLPLCLVMGAMLLGGFNYRCLVTALPPFLSGADAGTASLFRGGIRVFVVMLVGGCLGQLLGGWVADRFGNRVYPFLIVLLVVCAPLLGLSGGTPAALVLALLLSLFLFAQQPIENVLLAEWSDRRRLSRSYGIKFALTFGFGALGLQATGLVWTAFGYPGAIFFFLAGTGSVMILLYALAMHHVRKQAAQASSKSVFSMIQPCNTGIAQNV